MNNTLNDPSTYHTTTSIEVHQAGTNKFNIRLLGPEGPLTGFGCRAEDFTDPVEARDFGLGLASKSHLPVKFIPAYVCETTERYDDASIFTDVPELMYQAPVTLWLTNGDIVSVFLEDLGGHDGTVLWTYESGDEDGSTFRAIPVEMVETWFHTADLGADDLAALGIEA